MILSVPYQNKRTVPIPSTLPKTTFVPGLMCSFSHVCAALTPPYWLSPAGTPLVGVVMPGPPLVVMGSTHTSPVKVSAGPFAVAALREMSMRASSWQSSSNDTSG